MKHITITYVTIILSLITSFSSAQDVLLPHELEWFDLLKTWSEEIQEQTMIKTDKNTSNPKNSKTNIIQTSHFKAPKKLPKTGS